MATEAAPSFQQDPLLIPLHVTAWEAPCWDIPEKRPDKRRPLPQMAPTSRSLYAGLGAHTTRVKNVMKMAIKKCVTHAMWAAPGQMEHMF